jgi:hypothetical protein
MSAYRTTIQKSKQKRKRVKTYQQETKELWGKNKSPKQTETHVGLELNPLAATTIQ